MESVWEPYELAITAYALTLVNSPSKEVAAKMLERHARVAGTIRTTERDGYANVIKGIRLCVNVIILPHM